MKKALDHAKNTAKLAGLKPSQSSQQGIVTAEMAALVLVAGIATGLSGCGGGTNTLPDLTAPKVSSFTDKTNPAAPQVITANPDGSYSLAFLANQIQVFELQLDKPLWNPTVNLYPLALDANGKPTGLATANPVTGMTVTCVTNDPANATKVTCTVTTNGTFNLGNNAAKMIPLKFNYSGNVYGANTGTTLVNDTVSAVPVVLPALSGSLAPIATVDNMGGAPTTFAINAPVLKDAQGNQIQYQVAGLPPNDAAGTPVTWTVIQTGNTVNVSTPSYQAGLVGAPPQQLTLTLTSPKATGSTTQIVNITAQ